MFKSCLCKEELEFLNRLMYHHLPHNICDIDTMYHKWLLFFGNSELNSIKPISSIEFGKRLKEAREFKCYTRKELAEIIQISDRTLEAYECGLRVPTIDIFYLISQLLGLNL